MKAYKSAAINGGKMVRLGSHSSPPVEDPAWMSLPYFALPESGVQLLANREVIIYGDTLVNVPIVNNLTVTYTCAIGTQVGNNLVINSSVAGVYPCNIVFKNNGVTFETKTINLTVIPKTETVGKNILMIGASQMANGAPHYASVIDADLTACNYLGTQGSTVKHEGYSGQTWSWFLTDEASPFVKSGVLDIASYFTDNAITTPDYIVIMLGVNDLFKHCQNTGDGLTPAEITIVINKVKTLIDAFIAYNPYLKIILPLLPICDNNGLSWNYSYDESIYSQDKWIEIVHKYSVIFANTFANSAYSARVDCCYSVINLNRANYLNNGVHPTSDGYLQLGYNMASKLNQLIKIAPDCVYSTNTIAWFDSTDQSTITKDSSNYVSLWKDKRATGIDLAQSSTGAKPAWSVNGVLFDGSDDYMKAMFTGNKPKKIYLVFKQITWKTSANIMDGDSGTTRGALRQYTSTPNIAAYAGSYSGLAGNLPINTFGILRVCFNGIGSSLQLNEGTKITGNFGAQVMGGVVFGSHYGAPTSTYFSNIQIKEAIFRDIDDTSENEASIYAYLKNKYGL